MKSYFLEHWELKIFYFFYILLCFHVLYDFCVDIRIFQDFKVVLRKQLFYSFSLFFTTIHRIQPKWIHLLLFALFNSFLFFFFQFFLSLLDGIFRAFSLVSNEESSRVFNGRSKFFVISLGRCLESSKVFFDLNHGFGSVLLDFLLGFVMPKQPVVVWFVVQLRRFNLFLLHLCRLLTTAPSLLDPLFVLEHLRQLLAFSLKLVFLCLMQLVYGLSQGFLLPVVRNNVQENSPAFFPFVFKQVELVLSAEVWHLVLLHGADVGVELLLLLLPLHLVNFLYFCLVGC